MEIKKLDTLYALDKKNRVKEWSIKIIDKGDFSVIEWDYGYIDAKKINYQLQLNSGKNIGRANQTGHFQQAVMEATSRWKKKMDLEGYTLVKPEVEESKTPVRTQLFPMLAHEYQKHKSKIKFPCYVQRKLDGFRMVYDHHNDTMTSRTGKAFIILRGTELHKELQGVKCILDGELYLHGVPFESLGVLRKVRGLTASDKQLLSQMEYHVYDLIDTTLPFYKRYEVLKSVIDGKGKIKLVETVKVNTEEEINTQHIRFTSELYEGTMIRNADGMYKCKYRSTDLLKKKDFTDAEFKVTGYTSELGSRSSLQLVVWECETADGQKFTVRPQGTEEERSTLFNIAKDFIGRTLWVKYFELTEKGIPRFPTTKTASYTSYFRDQVV
ncbi:hypothetical protein EB118_17945 [bacterium]|nr:hypothetical protein [bacterium]NDD84896.1 hypothetical protein [bacterium]NDG31943.1 hypothetical protein [bacterium]